MSQLNVNTIGARTGNDITIASGKTLKDASGNAFITSGGLTEADEWLLTANVTTSTVISSNLARSSTTGVGSNMGTGMTVSSGIWTFPSTGFYLVTWTGFLQNGSSGDWFLWCRGTTDNSTYSNLGYLIAYDSSGVGYATSTNSIIFDVTDTSQCKIKFETTNYDSGDQLHGHATQKKTGFSFIKLGET